MDKEEARNVLNTKLAEYRSFGYEELKRRVQGEKEVIEIQAESGITYYIDILIVWDGKTGGVIRVMGLVDDGGFPYASRPLSYSFLVNPDDTILG